MRGTGLCTMPHLRTLMIPVLGTLLMPGGLHAQQVATAALAVSLRIESGCALTLPARAHAAAARVECQAPHRLLLEDQDRPAPVSMPTLFARAEPVATGAYARVQTQEHALLLPKSVMDITVTLMY